MRMMPMTMDTKQYHDHGGDANLLAVPVDGVNFAAQECQLSSDALGAESGRAKGWLGEIRKLARGVCICSTRNW